MTKRTGRDESRNAEVGCADLDQSLPVHVLCAAGLGRAYINFKEPPAKSHLRR